MDNAKHTRRRRLIQLYAALLHNAYVKGFITGDIYKGGGKLLCAPGLNCYSCPAAAASCPLGALQNALASANHRAGWYALGILVLYGVMLGRTVCGWLCPFGLIQELLHKLPTPKLGKGAVTRALSGLKYLLLAVFAVAVPLWYALSRGLPLPAFCKYICPAGTLEGAAALLAHPANRSFFSMLGLLFTRKLVILLAVILACVFCYRAFCRFLCPLGAIYSLFNRFSLVGARVDETLCNRCGACVRGCGMDVRRVGDRECIHCGQCMDACAKGAISIRAGRVTLMAPEPDRAPGKRRGLTQGVRAAMLVLLCLALLWFNVWDPAARTETPVGSAVGQRLEDFALTCYDGSEFRLSDQRGKVVFLNLWATYCTPCVRELDDFDALYRAHPDDIAVLAAHASLITADPEAFLSGKDYAIAFANDSDGALAEMIGGTGTLPQTVVLDRRGEIVYNQVGSVTPELLAALYEEAGE